MKIPFLIFKLLIGLALLVWMQVQVGCTVFPCGDHYYSLTEIHSYKILNRYLDNNLDSNFVKHSDTFDIIDLSYVFEFEYQLYDTSANDTKKRQTECNWIVNELDSVKVWRVFSDTLEEYTKYFNLGPNDLNAINSQERRPTMYGNIIPPRCIFLWSGLYNEQNNIPFQDSCQFRFDFYLPDIGKLSQLTESVFIAE
jgi:hypothetical protein